MFGLFQPRNNVWMGDVGKRKITVSTQDNYPGMITITGKVRSRWRIETVIEYVKWAEDAKHARQPRQWEQLELFKSKKALLRLMACNDVMPRQYIWSTLRIFMKHYLNKN